MLITIYADVAVKGCKVFSVKPLIKKYFGNNFFNFTVNKNVDRVEFPTFITGKTGKCHKRQLIHISTGTECGQFSTDIMAQKTK